MKPTTKTLLILLSLLFLQFLPSLMFAQDCNSDSLRILLRMYLDDCRSREPQYEQADCFHGNLATPLDTIIYFLGKDWKLMAFESINRILNTQNLDTNTLAELYYYKGYALTNNIGQSSNDMEKGMACFDSCLIYNKNYDLAWYNKAMNHFKLKEYYEAKDLFEKAINIDSTQMHYWLFYALAQHNIDQESKARRSFNKLIQLSDKSFDIYLSIGVTLQRMQYNIEAKRFLDSALQIENTDPTLLYFYGLAQYKVDSTQNYSQYLDSSLENISNERCILDYGIRASFNDLPKQAIKFYDKLLSINKSHAWAWFYKGTAHGKMQEYEIAANCFDNAVKYDTSTSFRLLDIMRINGLVSYGLYNRALDAFDDINMENESQEIIDYLYIAKAYIYYELKKYSEAAEILDNIAPSTIEDSAYINFTDSVYYYLNKSLMESVESQQ